MTLTTLTYLRTTYGGTGGTANLYAIFLDNPRHISVKPTDFTSGRFQFDDTNEVLIMENYTHNFQCGDGRHGWVVDCVPYEQIQGLGFLKENPPAMPNTLGE